MATHSPHTVDYHPEGTPDVPEEHSATQHVSLKTYLVVFALLMVLLVITVVAAFKVHIGHAGNIILALAIAVLKAGLVVLFFMHVKYASRLTKIFVVSGLVWLGIMFSLTLGDYLTRSWLPMSRGWVDQAAEHSGHPPVQVPPPAGEERRH
jgi:cytochrome c oxidase subunit 4